MTELGVAILLLVLLGLVAPLVGGVIMLPRGWVFRREQPGKFWALLAAQAFILCLVAVLFAFTLSH